MSDKKVVGIDSGKKPPEACNHCGVIPACPGISCPRIRRYWSDGAAWEVTYHKRWKARTESPPTGDETP